jgi:hypothetical protein
MPVRVGTTHEPRSGHGSRQSTWADAHSLPSGCSRARTRSRLPATRVRQTDAGRSCQGIRNCDRSGTAEGYARLLSVGENAVLLWRAARRSSFHDDRAVSSRASSRRAALIRVRIKRRCGPLSWSRRTIPGSAPERRQAFSEPARSQSALFRCLGVRRRSDKEKASRCALVGTCAEATCREPAQCTRATRGAGVASVESDDIATPRDASTAPLGHQPFGTDRSQVLVKLDVVP